MPGLREETGGPAREPEARTSSRGQRTLKARGIRRGVPGVAAAALLALALGAGLTPSPTKVQANHIPYAVGDVFAGFVGGVVRHYDSSGSLLETLSTTKAGFAT